MAIKISIIVPVYNSEKYIHRCVNSILNQTFKDFELILINDGSNDKSGKILDEYSRSDNRVRIIHQDNCGQGAARNKGLDIAVGDYIGFVDSDDWIHGDMYKILYNVSKKYEACIVQAKHNNLNKFKEDIVLDNELIVTEIDNIMRKFVACNSFEILPYIFMVNKLYKRELWNDLRFSEGKFAEDIRIIYKIYDITKKVVFVDNELYYYYMSSNSTTRGNFNVKKLEDLEAWEELIKFYNDKYQSININNLKMIYCRRLKNYYLLMKSNDSNYSKEMRLIKKKFRRNYIYSIKSKKLNVKEKLVCILFAISPNLYSYVIKE